MYQDPLLCMWGRFCNGVAQHVLSFCLDKLLQTLRLRKVTNDGMNVSRSKTDLLQSASRLLMTGTLTNWTLAAAAAAAAAPPAD